MKFDRPFVTLLAILAVATACIAGAYWLRFDQQLNLPAAVDPAAWGSFGDYVGGLLNPLISLFAFYWLGTSVRLQGIQIDDAATSMAEAARHQEQQASMTLRGHELATLNLELSAIQSEIAYNQGLLMMWLEQFNSQVGSTIVVVPGGKELPIFTAISGTSYTLEKLRRQQRTLIDQVKMTSPAASEGAG